MLGVGAFGVLGFGVQGLGFRVSFGAWGSWALRVL